MKFCRFSTDNGAAFGRIEGDDIIELDAPWYEKNEPTGRNFKLAEAKLLSPTTPSKVVMVGLNYRLHAEETGKAVPEEPCIFIKPDTAVIGPGDNIVRPDCVGRLDYEAELGIVIGRAVKNVGPDEARDAIAGFTCVNDVTARDLQAKDGQWTRAKGFDTFCPIGPWAIDDIDPSDLEIELLLNGDRKQHSTTADMIFSVIDIVTFISGVMTLRAGDVIGTGTPSGIGPMERGDTVEVRIADIGTLRNRVI